MNISMSSPMVPWTKLAREDTAARRSVPLTQRTHEPWQVCQYVLLLSRVEENLVQDISCESLE